MELLFKLFIKDKDNTADPAVHRAYGMLGGTVGIILNIILFVCKLTVGLATGSIGIVADAMNNIGDAGSSVITLVGFKLSGRPAHNDHPFGHGRAEYVTALFVSVAILLMGFELAKNSVSKIINPSPVEFSIASVVILAVAVMVKGWMYLFNKKIGKRIDSGSLIATARDSLSDSVATFAVLCGVLISHFAKINIDGFIGLMVAMFILYTGIKSVKESISPLLGQKPDPKLVKEIEEIVMSHENVIGMHDMIIHDYGPTRFMVSLHAEVPANTDIIATHDGIDHIERELKQRFGCDAVIHLDPIETDNRLVNENREMVRGILKDISPELSFHDFRMVNGPTHTNLIFDVVVPFGFEKSVKTLEEEIQRGISEKNENYFAVVDFDTEFTSAKE